MEQSQRDHRDLVSAFEMRDEDWASAVANTHIRRAANAYRAMRQGSEAAQAEA
jgi:DNA-binding FadR family transcriptional regulator